MHISTPRQKTSTSRPSRIRHLIKPPGSEERAVVQFRRVRIPAPVESAAACARPTLDDFGGRSDALGG